MKQKTVNLSEVSSAGNGYYYSAPYKNNQKQSIFKLLAKHLYHIYSELKTHLEKQGEFFISFGFFE